jgi:diguanylate cyclase (GGDEF)-like protein
LSPRSAPVVIDLSSNAEGDLFDSYFKRGYAKCEFSPVYHGKNLLGFIAIPRKASFSMQEDEKIFLTYLGEIIGVFFEYIHLKRDMQDTKTRMDRRFEDLNAVYTVSRSLANWLDVRSILENALDTILSQEVLNVQAKGGIFLFNEETGRLDLTCHRNIADALVQAEQSIDLGYCLCGRAAQSGQLILSTDCFEDKRHDTTYPGMGAHGHIILPLKANDRCLGVLFLYLPPGVEATKSQIDLLTAISNQLSIALENARLYEKVRHLSVHDPLTGLFNRRLFFDRLDEEISRSRRSASPLSLVMIDIDHFKKINDHHGHQAGDRVLIELSALMKKGMRKIDIVARFGGEEFTVLLPGADAGGACIAMERLRQDVEKHVFPVDDQGNAIPVTVSMGISTSTPDHPKEASELIRVADETLYLAKEAGRNRVASESLPPIA